MEYITKLKKKIKTNKPCKIFQVPERRETFKENQTLISQAVPSKVISTRWGGEYRARNFLGSSQIGFLRKPMFPSLFLQNAVCKHVREGPDTKSPRLWGHTVCGNYSALHKSKLRIQAMNAYSRVSKTLFIKTRGGKHLTGAPQFTGQQQRGLHTCQPWPTVNGF